MKKGAVAPVALPATPSWFSAGANHAVLSAMGAKLDGGGPHQSKTMMLADLTAVLDAKAEGRAEAAIVGENLLGKPSTRAREAAAYRLRQLYGLSDPPPGLARALVSLWRRDVAGRPLLALLCALARDPSLRGGAAAVLDAKVGEQVRWPAIAAAFEAEHPARLGAKMAKSLAQNAASSWTQAGFLAGAVRKIRARPVATPSAAAYAALLAQLSGFGGLSLLESRWLDVLDRPLEDRLGLLRQAEGLGLARVRSAGQIVEVEIRRPMADSLGIPDLVHG